MARYTVRSPDGKKITLNGPDGASPEEVIAQAQALYQPPAPIAPAPIANPLAVDPMAIAEPEAQLRPRYMDPTLTGPVNAPDPSLGAGFMDTMRNVGRKQYELSGNIMDAGANFIDDKIALNLPQIGKFGLETAVESAPEMALAAIPFVGPALFAGSSTQGMAEERAENNGGSSRDVQGMDLMEAAPFAAGNAMLERAGIKGLNSGGKNVATRIAKSTGKETITEAIQEPMEYAGSVIGTDEEFNTVEASKRSLGGAIGGATTGGTLKTGGEVTAAVANKITNKIPQDPERSSQDTATPTQDQAAPAADVRPPETTSQPEAAQGQSAATPPPVTPVSDPPTDASPEGTKSSKVVTPDGSMEVEANEEVVELDDLIAADAELQPRDRKRATSDLQIQNIASNLDPDRLAASRTTDSGSPIIGPDNKVESGNGRRSAIDLAYETNGEPAANYRKSIEQKGYDISGFKKPILVRRRTTDLTPEDRIKFTSLSNKSQIAELSSTEKASNDARQIDDDILELYQGGDPDSLDNQDFMKSFIGKVATQNESGALVGTDKRPTQEGVKRVKAALVAKAYNDSEIIENIFDSADPEVKSLGNVLRDRAAEVAQVAAGVRAGNVPERFDISKQIVEAVKMIRDAKRDKKRIQDVIEGTNQQSLIDEAGTDPLVEKIVKMVYRPGFGRMLSQPSLDKIIKQYTTQAKEQTDSDLFGENTTQPGDLLDAIYESVVGELEAKTDGQGDLTLERSVEETKSTKPAKKKEFADAPEPAKVTNSVDEDAANDGKKFTDFAKPTGANTLKNVFTDIGVSAEASVNMAPVKQIELIKKAMKSKFNINVDVEAKADIKDARDQLADMYVGLQFMANVLGMPSSFMGLNKTLSVTIEGGKKKYLGVYRPDDKSIGLPGRTNSFAHEWLHAFDHYILNELNGFQDNDLFSGLTRKDGVIDPSDGMQSAFANLMNAVFFDKSHLAAVVLELEHKALHSKSEKVKAEANRKLEAIKSGNFKGVKGKTTLYSGSKKLGKGDRYWTSPEEMLARSFEAYVAHKVNEINGNTQGLSKDNDAYLAMADERLAQTFTKALERLEIFDALDQFFSRVNENEILGKDVMPDQLPDTDLAVLDPKHWDKMFPGKFDNMPLIRRFVAQTKEAWKDDAKKKAVIKKRKKERKEMGIEETETVANGLRQIRDDAFRAMRAVLHGYEKRLPGVTELQQANNRLLSRPGAISPRSVYSSDVEKIATKNHNRIHNVGKSNNVKDMTDAQIQEVRDVMQSRTEGKGKVGKVAAGLRSVLDGLYDEMKRAGIDIGYLKNAGYLSRLYMRDVIMAKPDEFLAAATEVYEIQFDQIVEDTEGAKAAIDDLLKNMPDGFDIDKTQLKKLASELEAEGADVEALMVDMKDEIRAASAAASAEAWLHRIRVGREDSIESTSPYSGFTKARSLPPEADVILKDFLETDPFTIVSSYTDKVAQKIAVHNVKTPKNGPTLESLYKKMLAKNVSKSDVDAIRNYHDTIMGLTEESASSKRAHPALSRMYTFGTLMLLGRAVVSSLAEPMTFAMQTGDVKNAFRSLKITMDQIIKTNDMKQINEMARAIGLVTEDFVDTTIDARLGGGLRVGVGDREVLSGFFRKTMLTPLTNSQRSKVLMLSFRHFTDLANQMDSKKINATKKGQIERKLGEWGVPVSETETFLKWLKNQDGIPALDKLDTPMGKIFVDAAWNLNKKTVQDPKKEDRPYYANTPAGSIIFSVTSFGFAYWENVSKAMARRITTTARIDGGYEASKLAGNIAAGYASLYAATFVYQAMRVALTDPEKWKELDDEDELLDYLMLRAFDYTAIHGPVASFGINAWKGVRYMRDLATSFSGAHLSSYFDFMQKQAKILLQNSPNTNTAEYNAAQSFFKTIVGTSLAWVISKMPGGPVVDAAQGVGISYVTSQGAADQAAKLLVGEKGEKKRGPKEPEPPAGPKPPKAPD